MKASQKKEEERQKQLEVRRKEKEKRDYEKEQATKKSKDRESARNFDSFYNNEEDVNCLFGKGISNIGLLNLDDALSFFEKVIEILKEKVDLRILRIIIPRLMQNTQQKKDIQTTQKFL